jgi:hypothetical protein
MAPFGAVRYDREPFIEQTHDLCPEPLSPVDLCPKLDFGLGSTLSLWRQLKFGLRETPEPQPAASCALTPRSQCERVGRTGVI